MKGKHIDWSEDRYEKHDPQSRQVIKSVFKKRGKVLIDNPDKYDVDLISEDGTVQVEVEHRDVWSNPKFPFSDVNVPERKDKFFKLGKAHYCIVSRNFDRFGFIHKDVIQKYMKPKFLVEVYNKFIKNGEYFYKIPQSEFEFFSV